MIYFDILKNNLKTTAVKHLSVTCSNLTTLVREGGRKETWEPGRGDSILIIWHPTLKLSPQGYLSPERLSSGRRMAPDSGAGVAS